MRAELWKNLRQPVVVRWSEAEGLSIDAAATKRASLAGADSLAKLRAAVK